MDAMGLIIRAMEARDAAKVARLSQCLGYDASAEQIAQRIEQIELSSRGLLLVAERQGGVVGWLQAQAVCVIESGFRVEIVGLIVHEGHRQAGVGRALVAAAESWAWSLGAASVVVRTNITRQESHPFYRALGYANTKSQEVYRKARQ